MVGGTFAQIPPARLRKTRMFKGHMLFGLHEILPQPSTYITVLRDPVDRGSFGLLFYAQL